MDLLEGLADATPAMRGLQHPAWRRCATPVVDGHPQDRAAGRRGPGRRRRLRVRRAVRRARRRSGTTTYGDLATTGYIVTPTLPAGLVATPREPRAPRRERRPRTSSAPRRRVRRACAAVRTAADGCVELVTTLLDDAGINYLSVTGRAKSRRVVRRQGRPRRRRRAALPRPAERDHRPDRRPGRSPTCTATSPRSPTCSPTSSPCIDDRDMGQETAREGRFGYASRHLLVAVDPAAASPPAYARCAAQRPGAGPHGAAARVGRVRARHPLQGHDPRGARARPRPPVHAGGRAARARRPRVLDDPRPAPGGDDRPARPSADDDDPRISARDLATFLAGQYADAGWSRTDHYAWISGLLLELGITSLDELADVLRLGRQRRRSTTGWATATRRARSADSTTRCSRCSASATSTCTATRTGRPAHRPPGQAPRPLIPHTSTTDVLHGLDPSGHRDRCVDRPTRTGRRSS